MGTVNSMPPAHYVEHHQTIVNVNSIDTLKKNIFNLMDSLTEFRPIATSLKSKFDRLVKECYLEFTGDDSAGREFVSIQAIVEKALVKGLEEKTIDSVVGIIHTPLPATPVCTQGEISSGLVSAQVGQCEMSITTITERAKTIRNFIQLGEMIIAYPEKGIIGGLEKNQRTPEQIDTYLDLLSKNSVHLHDFPLSLETLSADEIGCFYVIKINEKSYVFAIQAPQANTTNETSTFKVWFGEASNPIIRDRICRIVRIVLSKTSNVLHPDLNQFDNF